MNFSFSVPITKETLLAAYSEETYMEYYLGFPVDNKLHVNPLRQDRNPTASFYRAKNGTLLFHDFGDGSKRDFIAVVMAKYNVSYHRALSVIANDFNIQPNPNLQINPGYINTSASKFVKEESAHIQVKIRDFTKEDLQYWKQFGIEEPTLRLYNVFSCDVIFLNGYPHLITGNELSFGYFGGFLKGKELWRIYFPTRKQHRFITNWRADKIQGWDQLDHSGDVIVVTKSMKDVMLLHELGIQACAPNSEMLFLTESQRLQLKKEYKKIVVLYDNDLPGIRSMNRLRKKFPEFIYTFIPRNTKSKDLSDYYRDHGKQKTLELIDEFRFWLEIMT